MIIPKHKIVYSRHEKGDYIITLRNKVAKIIDIYQRTEIESNEYGDEEYEKTRWYFKVEFLCDGKIMDLLPGFGTLQKIEISNWSFFVFYLKKAASELLRIINNAIKLSNDIKR